QWFLLLGVAGGLAVATLFQLIRYPYYAHGKALYETSASLTMCALGAIGLDILSRPLAKKRETEDGRRESSDGTRETGHQSLLNLLSPGSRLPSIAVAILLGTWGCTAYASFWIQGNKAMAHNWAGLQYLIQNRNVLA